MSVETDQEKKEDTQKKMDVEKDSQAPYTAEGTVKCQRIFSSKELNLRNDLSSVMRKFFSLPEPKAYRIPLVRRPSLSIRCRPQFQTSSPLKSSGQS